MRLKDKIALITGAAGGQGVADAQMFVKEGARVVVTDVNEQGGKALAEKLCKERTNSAVFVKQDVTSSDSWQEVLDVAVSKFGGLHVLVNNAGIIDRQKINDMKLSSWDRIMAVNLTGPMLGMKICAPQIKKSGGGSIVNVSSMAGMLGHYDAAYSSSKWALRGLSKAAAIEYLDWNIRVNSIHPAQIAGTTLAQNAPPGFSEANKRTIPMGRQGTPDECAYLVVFLASDESTFMTGTEISIDGGFSDLGAIFMRSKMQEMILKSQNA